jgi:hypothetical protein
MTAEKYEKQIEGIRASICAAILGHFPENANILKVEGIAIEYNLGKDENREVYAIGSTGNIFVYSSFYNDDDFEAFPFDINEDDDDYPDYEDNIDILESLETEELLNLLKLMENGKYKIIE